MRTKVLSLAAVALSLALLGAGCKKPSTPSAAVENMKRAMVKVEQVAFELTASGSALAASVPSTGGASVDAVEARLSGQLQRGRQQVANGAGQFSIKTTGAQAMEAMGEYRMVNGVHYARMTALPALQGFDLSQFENQWFSFPGSMNDVMEKAEEKTLSESQIRDLERLFTDRTLFSSVTEVGTENLRGQNTTVYEVMLDEEEVVSVMQEAARITEEPFTDADRNEARETVRKWNARPGRLWIGNGDSYLYRVMMFLQAEQDEEGTVQIDLFDHNKPVPAVEAPAGARDFGSMMGGMFGGAFMGGASSPDRMMDLGSVPGLTPEMMQQYQDLQKMMLPPQ